MTKTSAEIILNCFQIEDLVREIILIKNVVDNKSIVKAIEDVYHPESTFEMEMYSEAILLSRLSVLN